MRRYAAGLLIFGLLGVGPCELKPSYAALTKRENPVSDAEYDASWDGDTRHAPSKNSVYDKISSLVGMAYPSAGLAKSTGSAWDTSITDNSTNWDSAYGWGNHADAGYYDSLSDLQGAVTNDFHNLGGTDLDTDEKVKYDAADAAAGYLGTKTVAGSGITLAEGTGGDADKLQITNSAPDQTVSITGDSDIGVSGTYPSFTLSFDNGTGYLTNETDPVFVAWLPYTNWPADAAGALTNSGAGVLSWVSYLTAESDPLSWSIASDQTDLTGDKSGSFDLTTTGNITSGIIYGTRTTDAVSLADLAAVHGFTVKDLDADEVAVGTYGYLKNTGSIAMGVGHGIGVLGLALDTASGTHDLYGFEGRVNALGSGGIPTGALGLSTWQGATFTGRAAYGVQARTEITTDGTTPLAEGLAVQFYAPAIIGGQYKYSFYGIDAFRVDNELNVLDTAGTNRMSLKHNGTDSYLESFNGHLVLKAPADKFVISSGVLGFIPLADSVQTLGYTGFEWATAHINQIKSDTGTVDFDNDNTTTTGTVTGGALAVWSEYTLPTTDGDAGQVPQTNGSGVVTWVDAGGGGHVIEDNGTPLTARANLNFTGSITATDDAGNDQTEISIDDDFLKNTGDSGTGAYDFGGADSFEIPNAAGPTVDATGEIALDTTDNSLIMYDGTAARVYAHPIKVLTKFIEGAYWDNQTVFLGQLHKDMACTIIQVDATAIGSSTPVLTYNIEERAWASYNSAGTDVYASDQTADGDGESETSFDNAGIAAQAGLFLTTGASSESGTVTGVEVTIYYRMDVE